MKKMVVPMAIREFPALVKKAKTVEHLEGGSKVIRTHGGGSSSTKKGNFRRSPILDPNNLRKV